MRNPLNKRKQFDARKGGEQCPFILPHASGDGFLCCTYKKRHRGPHHTCYEIDEGRTPQSEWKLRSGRASR